MCTKQRPCGRFHLHPTPMQAGHAVLVFHSSKLNCEKAAKHIAAHMRLEGEQLPARRPPAGSIEERMLEEAGASSSREWLASELGRWVA